VLVASAPAARLVVLSQVLLRLCWTPDQVSVRLPPVNGEWHLPAKSKTIPDPLNGEPFINVPDTQARPAACSALATSGPGSSLAVAMCDL